MNESAPTDLPLAAALGAAIDAMWPRRAHQELLLDLGERKPWGEDERRGAVEQAAAWLVGELGLPSRIGVVAHPGVQEGCDDLLLEHLRALVACDKSVPGAPGVAAWVSRIAPAVGASPKTLANSLARPLRSDRADHRWLRTIGRAVGGHHHLDAWSFHRRSPGSMTAALGSIAGRTGFDAGDALIVVSLLALWQRRRPTSEAKGNRGRPRSRRSTPKPVAALLGTLAQPAQAAALVELARRAGPACGPALAVLALEAALTEAHLAPHPSRSAAAHGVAGTEWLVAADRALDRCVGVLDETDLGVTRFRIDRLRAWLARRPQPLRDEHLRLHPYVAATLALEALIVDPHAEPLRFSGSAPGVFMLVPALRSKGMLEEP